MFSFSSRKVFISSSFPLLLLLASCGGGSGGGLFSSSSTTTEPDRTPTFPNASSITDSGSISGFSYGLWNEAGPSGSRVLRADIIDRNAIFISDRLFQYPQDSVTVTYKDNDGFRGIYSYKGETGEIISDVFIEATFFGYIEIDPRLTGYIGQDRDIIMGGDNFGYIDLGLNDIDANGNFSDTIYLSRGGDGTVEGSFSNDGTSSTYPQFVAGEIKLKRFYKDFENYDSRSSNSLVGVFVAEKQ